MHKFEMLKEGTFCLLQSCCQCCSAWLIRHVSLPPPFPCGQSVKLQLFPQVLPNRSSDAGEYSCIGFFAFAFLVLMAPLLPEPSPFQPTQTPQDSVTTDPVFIRNSVTLLQLSLAHLEAYIHSAPPLQKKGEKDNFTNMRTAMHVILILPFNAILV